MTLLSEVYFLLLLIYAHYIIFVNIKILKNNFIKIDSTPVGLWLNHSPLNQCLISLQKWECIYKRKMETCYLDGLTSSTES